MLPMDNLLFALIVVVLVPIAAIMAVDLDRRRSSRARIRRRLAMFAGPRALR